MFRLAYHRGLRASEVGNLELSDYREIAGRPPVARLSVKRLKGRGRGVPPDHVSITGLGKSISAEVDNDWLERAAPFTGPKVVTVPVRPQVTRSPARNARRKLTAVLPASRTLLPNRHLNH
jgi:hypothetical protein